MKPAILITGGAGYIGSHTALQLAQQGHPIIILDTFTHGQQFDPSWATVIRKDFSDKDTLHEIFTRHKIQAVMHFAACIEVGLSVKQPLLFYENNVTKTLQLLSSMMEHGVNQLIFSSSCAVYGVPDAVPLREDHSKNPISPYGKTKLMVESILQDFHQAYGLQFVALRYFNAAGALPSFGLKEQHEPETHAIPLLLKAAKVGSPFYVFGTDYPTPDGSCVRDFLHVLDIAKAHALALDYLTAGGKFGFFNLGTGSGFSVRQLIDTVQKVTHHKVNAVMADRRAGDPAVLVADPSHAMQTLGWRPEHSDLAFILQTAV